MKIRILSLVLVVLLSALVTADIVDQNNPGGATFHGITSGYWHGQTFTPELPVLTAVELWGMGADHPWVCTPGSQLTVSIYEAQGFTGINLNLGSLLGSATRTAPFGPSGTDQQWNGKFELGSIDVSSYMENPADNALVMLFSTEAGYAGEETVLLTESNAYADGTGLQSNNGGTTWTWDLLGPTRDLTFRTYGTLGSKAYDPSPTSPSTVYVADANTLSWTAGDGAVTHKVYWSDVEADVVNRTATPITLTVAIDGNSTTTPSTPVIGKEYYWVVDEIDSVPSTHSGTLWQYTVDDYLYVDDMESYENSTGKEIWNTWVDGYYGTSGSALTVQLDGADGTAKAMEFIYSNNGTSPYGPSGYPYFSEAVANTSDLECGSDWTVDGLAFLELKIKGQAGNDVNERMYLAIEDSTPNFAMTQYGLPDSYSNPEWPEDMNNLKFNTWYRWGIDLRSFAGVNLADVQKVYIGFGVRGNTTTLGGTGTVIIDEIKLRIPGVHQTVIPLSADLNDDNTVNFKDLAILANDWALVGSTGIWPEL